jgi:hypothetical protein
MPHRTYVGPHDEVEIAATGQVVRRGQSVEVDAEFAETLDAQPENWAKPNTKAAKDAPSPRVVPAEPDPATHDGQPIIEESA